MNRRPQPGSAAGRRNRPARPGPRTVEPRAIPPRHAGENHALTPATPHGNDSRTDTDTKLEKPRTSQTPKDFMRLARTVPGDENGGAHCCPPTSVGLALRDRVLKIDAGVPHPRVFPRLRREREYQSLRFFQGSAGACAPFVLLAGGKVMQVIYERCAAVDVARRDRGRGKPATARAVTVRRTYKTFYGCSRGRAVAHAEGVTTWRWRRPGSTRCPLPRTDRVRGLREGAGCATPGRERSAGRRRTWRRGVAGAAAGVRAAGRSFIPPAEVKAARDVIRYRQRSPSSGSARSPASERAAGRGHQA